MEIGFAKAASEADENKVLNAIAFNPKRSIAEIARVLGWVSKDGRPAKSKVHRAIMRLRDDKLVTKARGERVVITPAGRKEIGLDDN
jgi:DNA-binding MarR family transcriptional regulator